MKIKLLSVNQVYSSLRGVFLRFPLAVITAFAAAIIAIVLVEQNYDALEQKKYLIKILLTLSLAFPLFIAITFITETSIFNKGRKLAFHVVAVITALLYYLHFDENIKPVDYQKTLILNIAMHLFVAYAPYLSTYNENGFWQFNKTLFLRFLLSLFYSVVLYSGLSVAFLAIENLFDLNLGGNIYIHLWIIVLFIFNSIFFLAGIPQNIKGLDFDDSYPKGLKIFTQFVLIPLVILYLLILYVYGLKILVFWQLPRGWVSYLVLFFSATGIFSLLMIHPLKNKEQNKWINIYNHWYYRLLFPLIILLFIAIYVRVENYGITENRYFIIVLAFWLLATIIYHLFSKKKHIIWIPITLSIVAILSVLGPWSAFTISEKSQIKRLQKLLTENNILQKGKIVPATDTIALIAEAEIGSIVRYLEQTHGFHNMQPWFEKDLEKLFTEKDSLMGYVNKAEVVLNQMGLKNIYNWQQYDNTNYLKTFNYYADKFSHISITGYDELVQFSQYPYDTTQNIQIIELTLDTLRLEFNASNNKYIIWQKNENKIAEFDLKEFVATLNTQAQKNRKEYSIRLPSDLMFKIINTNSYQFKFIIHSIYGEIDKGQTKINGIEGQLLIAYPAYVRRY